MFKRVQHPTKDLETPLVLTRTETKIEIVEHHRLTVDQYKLFEKSLPGLGEPRTDLQAGYLLGIQHALKVLRDGWVVGV